MPTAAARTREPSRSEHRTFDHVNDVVLVGELAAEPELRTLPSGDEVLSFRVTVRAGPVSLAAKTAAPVARSRSDSIDCAAWRPDVQTRVRRFEVGDLIEIAGAVHHRYWRGAGGLSSRYEVEADRVKVIAKAAAVAKAAAAAKAASSSSAPPDE